MPHGPLAGELPGIAQSLLDALPANAVIVNLDGRILATNRAWTAFGRENGLADGAAAPGANYFDECRRGAERGESIAREVADALRQVNSGARASYTLDYPCHSPTRQRWYRLQIRPLELDTHRYLLIEHLDVTAARQTDEHLKSIRKHQRLLLDANPNPSWVIDPQTDAFLTVNAAAMKRYGFTKEEFRRMTLRDLAAESVDGGEKNPRSGPARHRSHSGEIINVELHHHPVFYEGRELSLMVAIDVTKEVQAAARLREQAALIDEAHDAIIVTDLNHRITFWSKGAVKLYGWSSEEATGREVAQLLQISPPAFQRARSELLMSGAHTGEETKTTRRGDRIIVQTHWTLLRDESGLPRSILCFDYDVTDAKETEYQLFRAQRVQSIGALAGGIAHDFNNVLAPIVMAAGLLRLRHTSEADLRILGMIEGSAMRGSQLVKQILSFARGVAGERAEIDLRQEIREIAEFAESTFPKSIKVEVSMPERLPTVIADKTQIGQVLMNLALNARDAMTEGGTLSLRAREETFTGERLVRGGAIKPGRYVTLEVCDNGCGIPAETGERIFDPFFTTKSPGKGTGLGLATVRAIASSHGGYIDFQSQVGYGTCFQVFLPASDFALGVDVAIPVRSIALRGKGERILVIDDESAVRELAAQALQLAGFTVETAESAEKAMDMLAQNRPFHAVISDWSMPGSLRPGALITALTQLPNAPKMIVMSGSAADVVGNLPRGVKILSKPFLPEMLVREVLQLLGTD